MRRCQDCLILTHLVAVRKAGKVSVMSDQVEVWMELEPAQALALAQFVKRVGWSEIRQNAIDDDEAYAMREALVLLAKALGESGYAPR